MKSKYPEDGFTLIEVLVAMVVLTIGVLSLFAMQIGSIRSNSVANHMTDASTRGQDQIEQILSWVSADPRLIDNNFAFPGAGAKTKANPSGDITADGTAGGAAANQEYTVYWNGTAVMDPVIVAQQVGINLQIHVVWMEAGISKQLTLNIIKPI
jgi:type IV pilus modification protein PilV